MTVGQLIEQLRHYPEDIPVVVYSYEEGDDPVTGVEVVHIVETPARPWYVGVYQRSERDGRIALLIASKYYKAESDTG